MKRLICILLILFLLSPAAQAAAAYETAGDLWQAWNQHSAIPDYIAGVWSSDGSTDNLTFGLVPGEAGEAGKQEILSLIVDDSTAQFVIQTYSRNYLLSILDDVNTYFNKDLGFMSTGLYDYDNQVKIELHTDYRENPESLAAVEELQEKYADAVDIQFTDTIYELTIATNAMPPFGIPARPGFPWSLLLLGCLTLVVFLALLHTRRRMYALANGEVFTHSKLTASQVEDRIRREFPPVSRDLDRKMAEAIRNLTE